MILFTFHSVSLSPGVPLACKFYGTRDFILFTIRFSALLKNLEYNEYTFVHWVNERKIE